MAAGGVRCVDHELVGRQLDTALRLLLGEDSDLAVLVEDESFETDGLDVGQSQFAVDDAVHVLRHGHIATHGHRQVL